MTIAVDLGRKARKQTKLGTCNALLFSRFKVPQRQLHSPQQVDFPLEVLPQAPLREVLILGPPRQVQHQQLVLVWLNHQVSIILTFS